MIPLPNAGEAWNGLDPLRNAREEGCIETEGIEREGAMCHGISLLVLTESRLLKEGERERDNGPNKQQIDAECVAVR